MPVLARLDWVAKQITDYGRAVHLVVGKAANPGILKVRIILHAPEDSSLSPFVSDVMLSQLKWIRQLCSAHLAADKGHKHTNGISEVGIWIRCRAEAASPASPPRVVHVQVPPVQHNERQASQQAAVHGFQL